MLWTLLTAMSSCAFAFTAWATARQARAQIGTLLIIIAVGVALGICNFWCLDKVADAAEDRLRPYGEPVQERVLRVIYFTAAMWVFGAPFLSHWVSIRVLSLFA